MKQVLGNPFRVLGLPITASDRQIAKRVMEAETLLELGKPLKIDGDFPWMPPVERTVASMKEAQGKLHRLEDRSYHACFWFHAHDSVDQLALEVLQAGNIEKALSLWTKVSSISNLINLYVLRFALAAIEQPEAQDHFLEGVSVLGRAFNAGEKLQAFMHTSNIGRVDSSRILRDIQQEALQRFANGNQVLALSSQEIRVLISAFIEFPQADRVWIEKRLFNEAKDELEASVKECAELRDENAGEAIEAAQSLIRKARPILIKVASTLPKGDPEIAHLHDLVSEEILQCSIEYHNLVMKQDSSEEQSLQPAVKIARQAESWARGPALKNRIAESLPVLLGHAENQAAQAEVKPFMEEFFLLLETLPKPGQIPPTRIWGIAKEVEAYISKVRVPLHGMKAALGESDPNYLQLSSLAVHASMTLIIEFANRTNNMNAASRVINSLFDFDMDEEARTRLENNARTAASNASRNSSCYIATCVYGHPEASEVVALRRFRDTCLLPSILGRALVSIYYWLSPSLARHLARVPLIHPSIRWLLRPLAQRWMKLPLPQ